MTSGRAADTGTADLSAAECWRLLRDSEVGRLAVLVDGRPDVFPVNHVVDHGTVVIRTGAGTKLSATPHGAAVAFEVDGYDAGAGSAWSVVVKGDVERFEGVQEMVDAVGLPLVPWHAGPKPAYVRVVPNEVTGRRFVAAPGGRRATGTGAAPGR